MQFVLTENELEPANVSVCEFLKSLVEGQTVVVLERVRPVAQGIRGDDITELAWFRSASEIQLVPPGRYSAVYSMAHDGRE
ncbi:MAG: hypothetical protein ND807_13450 [Vicinamibacterales bacterium]|nr:hypothetical protein [Vicinamibacterales bacterium]